MAGPEQKTPPVPFPGSPVLEHDGSPSPKKTVLVIGTTPPSRGSTPQASPHPSPCSLSRSLPHLPHNAVHKTTLAPRSALKINPTSFKDMIIKGTAVSLTIFLLIVKGLPPCQKSVVVEKFIDLLNSSDDDKKKTQIIPQHGLSFHEFASFEYVESGQSFRPELGYSITKPDNCYLHAMNAGMAQVRGDALRIEYEDDDVAKKNWFNDERLNEHFRCTFSQLKTENENTVIWGSQGFALINVWDIGQSPTVYHFLPALHGCLHHSYSWLFFDLHHSRNLYKPLELKENLLKFRPRIHYLIRSAKLNLPDPDLPEKKKKKVCSMFAMIPDDTEVDDTEVIDKIQSVKRDFESTAAQIGVSDRIDFDNVTPLQLSNCKKVIKEKMDALIFQELRERSTLPFSFIFLRNFYYKDDTVVYVRKKDIQELAKELRIDKFDEFCKFFTSWGSIIDVSLIDSKSEYIIMKPSKFLEEIDKIFHTEDDMLRYNGILTLATAESLFGQAHAAAYTNILVSFSLAIELRKDQIELLNQFYSIDSEKVWYLPDIRCTPPCSDTSELRPHVLRLLRSYNSSPGHLQASFVTHFLKINRSPQICIEDETPANVTKIKAMDENEQSIKFDVTYFGTALEFYTPVANKEIFSQIIDTCHEIMKHDKETKYNFAILCAKDPSHTHPHSKYMYELTRDRHLLPCKDTALCDECKRKKHPHLQVWNEVVESSSKRFSDFEERKLNGDTISLGDATKIATNLDGLSANTINILVQKLGINLDEHALSLRRWKLPMMILMECEKKYPEGISKRDFVRQLAEVASDINCEKDQLRLHKVVYLLDNEMLKDLVVSAEHEKKIPEEHSEPIFQYPNPIEEEEEDN